MLLLDEFANLGRLDDISKALGLEPTVRVTSRQIDSGPVFEPIQTRERPDFQAPFVKSDGPLTGASQGLWSTELGTAQRAKCQKCRREGVFGSQKPRFGGMSSNGGG